MATFENWGKPVPGTPKRGEPMTFRLRSSSHEKFIVLHNSRINKGMNATKSDILSDAIDMLYEKEINKGKE